MSNVAFGKRIRTGTGWKHYPVVEQVRMLWARMQFTGTKAEWVALFIFGLALAGLFALVVTFNAKEWSDIGGLAFLYIATLLLALPPEHHVIENQGEYTKNKDEKDSSKRAFEIKRRRHLRVAVAMVICGTMMQATSYYVGLKQSNAQQAGNEKTIDRLNRLEQANAGLKADLKNANARIQVLETGTEQ